MGKIPNIKPITVAQPNAIAIDDIVPVISLIVVSTSAWLAIVKFASSALAISNQFKNIKHNYNQKK